jgi:hypothetical protein
MTRHHRIHDQATRGLPATGALFARKGEAVPVGGRAAARRVITMRPPSHDPLGPIALPRPANTSMPVTPARTIRPEPREAAWPDTPSNVVPIVPTMGPVAGAAAIHAATKSQRRRPTRTAARDRSMQSIVTAALAAYVDGLERSGHAGRRVRRANMIHATTARGVRHAI